MTFYIACKKTIYTECVAREVFPNFVRNNKEEKVLAGEPYLTIIVFPSLPSSTVSASNVSVLK